MNKKQEKAFCKAMTKRLRWYEEASKGFFSFQPCNICEVFRDDAYWEECELCPLDPCFTPKRILAHQFINERAGNVKSIEIHCKDLIRKIKKAGFEYV